ncbi:Xaa-Pro dipeptidyl-peptidase, partial [Streptococcus suis]|nr:Xaa-Pro dipeptidyl-peptidase [Streptococcus suis]
LLGYANHYYLPHVIWQDNSGEQTWTTLDTFGGENEAVLPLGTGSHTIANQYAQEDFDRYGKSYPAFHQDLYASKGNQVSIDLPVTEDLLL